MAPDDPDDLLPSDSAPIGGDGHGNGHGHGDPSTGGGPDAALEGDATVGALLGRCLRAAGVTRVFGSGRSGIVGIPGLGHLRVDEPEVATLLADSQGAITHGARPGAAVLPGRRLRIGWQPGVEGRTLSLTDVHDLPEIVAGFVLDPRVGAVEIELDVDLDAPPPAGLSPLTVNPAGALMTLSPSLADLGLVVVAGPGVVRAGAVAALRGFAAHAGIGVIETFGARGLVPAADPAHFGTVGLQERDLDLAGLGEARIVIAVGLEGNELDPRALGGRQVLEVEPFQLAALAYQWPVAEHPPGAPAGPGALAALLDSLRESDSSPLNPVRALVDLGVVRRGAPVFADPGPVGLWALRALTAIDPADVVVPTHFTRGFAVAAAMVAALDGRSSFALTLAPRDSMTEALLDMAGRVGSQFTLVEWGADVTWADANAHRVALRSAAQAPGIAHVPVPVDLASATRALVDLAGPVSAWAHGGAPRG